MFFLLKPAKVFLSAQNNDKQTKIKNKSPKINLVDQCCSLPLEGENGPTPHSTRIEPQSNLSEAFPFPLFTPLTRSLCWEDALQPAGNSSRAPGGNFHFLLLFSVPLCLCNLGPLFHRPPPKVSFNYLRCTFQLCIHPVFALRWLNEMRNECFFGFFCFVFFWENICLIMKVLFV